MTMTPVFTALSESQQAECTRLINLGSVRLLTLKEDAELLKFFWLKKGFTIDSLKKMTNRAYYLSKQESAGLAGRSMLQELQTLETILPSTDFRILYAACK
jgi:hypothetical protein